jgi:hypothetical protein
VQGGGEVTIRTLTGNVHGFYVAVLEDHDPGFNLHGGGYGEPPSTDYEIEEIEVDDLDEIEEWIDEYVAQDARVDEHQREAWREAARRGVVPTSLWTHLEEYHWDTIIEQVS